MPEIPDNPRFNMRPNTLIYARYDPIMAAFGGKGSFVEDPERPEGCPRGRDELPLAGMVNVLISQSSTGKTLQFRWHS
jgi:hypothetical protein